MTNMQQQQGKQPQATGTAATQQVEAQQRYWRDQYRNEPYYDAKQPFESYQPAYTLGAQARQQNPGKQFDAVEDQLRQQYEAGDQASRKLEWAQAKQAVRAAWNHAENAITGKQQEGRNQAH